MFYTPEVTWKMYILVESLKLSQEVEMSAQIYGTMLDKRTLLLNRPLKSNEKEILVKLKKEPIVKTKIDVPEDIVLEIAEKDIEELV